MKNKRTCWMCNKSLFGAHANTKYCNPCRKKKARDDARERRKKLNLVCIFCKEKPISKGSHKYCMDCKPKAKKKYSEFITNESRKKQDYLKSLSVDELLNHMREEHNI